MGITLGLALALYVGTAPGPITAPNQSSQRKNVDISQIATSIGPTFESLEAEEAARIERPENISALEKQVTTVELLPKLYARFRSLQNVESSYNLQRETVIVTGEIQYRGFSNTPDWKVIEVLEEAQQKLCKSYTNLDLHNLGLPVEFNLRNRKDDLTIGSILLSKTECNA